MEWTAQIIGGIGGLVLLNILVWVFLWGKRTGNINTKITTLEEKAQHQSILPECSDLFTELKEKTSNIEGKTDVILLMMKENQKNKEKRHITKVSDEGK